MKKQGNLRRKKKRKEDGKKRETYAIEVDSDGSVRIDRCCFATQRHDLAEDADGLVCESLEILGMYPRRSFRGCHVFFDSVVKTDREANLGGGRAGGKVGNSPREGRRVEPLRVACRRARRL